MPLRAGHLVRLLPALVAEYAAVWDDGAAVLAHHLPFQTQFVFEKAFPVLLQLFDGIDDRSIRLAQFACLFILVLFIILLSQLEDLFLNLSVRPRDVFQCHPYFRGFTLSAQIALEIAQIV